MPKKYSYGRQSISESDISSVVDCLKSDWLTQGPLIPQFEKALGEKFGAKYVSAVSNGTAALHLAGLALGWGREDIIVTTPITFVASANCILYSGAIPDFSDIDPLSYTLDLNKLEEKLKLIYSQGKKIKAVVAVDFAGHPCDWQGLRFLADKYSFKLIDDNCHALGAEYKNSIKYAAKYADLVVMSFHPVKHITTGEGGAILTNDPELDKKIKKLRSHGITKDPEELTHTEGFWYYEMNELGFNYRITDFQCALGISQLGRIDEFIRKRRGIAEFYDETFIDDKRIITPNVSEKCKHSYHLYPLSIDFEKYNIDKSEYFTRLQKNNINCQVHYIPVHLQPYYKKKFGFKINDFPAAEKFYKSEISIPIYPSLEKEDLIYIADKITSLL